MMVLCDATVIFITEYDGRRLGLPSAPVVMEHDNSITEEYPSKHTTQPIFTYSRIHVPMVTLSVSTTPRTSSSATPSPASLVQFRRTAVVMLSPRLSSWNVVPVFIASCKL